MFLFFRSCPRTKSKMKFGAIVLLLSVSMLAQSVFGTITNCQQKNRVLKRRIACLYHKNKGLLSMLEDLKG